MALGSPGGCCSKCFPYIELLFCFKHFSSLSFNCMKLRYAFHFSCMSTEPLPVLVLSSLLRIYVDSNIRTTTTNEMVLVNTFSCPKRFTILRISTRTAMAKARHDEVMAGGPRNRHSIPGKGRNSSFPHKNPLRHLSE